MRDNELFIHCREWLIAKLPARIGGLVPEVVQSYQPSQQGRISTAAIYFFKLPDVRVGQRRVGETFDHDTLTMVRSETQAMATTLQWTCLAPVAPADTMAELTDSDIAKSAAAVFQSPDFIASLKAMGAGVQRVGEVRNVPFENDLGQFEENASFDVTITHNDVFVDVVPGAATYAVAIKRV